MNSNSKILMIIGNGFSKSYLDHKGIEINSSKPLTGFESKKCEVNIFLDKIPDLKNIIDKYNNEDHFKLIEEFLSDYNNDDRLICFMKRFITLAYSKFQLEIEKESKIEKWEFSKWILNNKKNISDIYSLNYDLIVENILDSLGIRYCRPFTSEMLPNVKYDCYIYKPHGSIDFDLPSSAIKISEESIWSSIIFNNQANINGQNLKIVERESYLKPRVQQDVVLPSSENDQMKISWVKKMYKMLFSRMNNFEKIIIFGFGYRYEDRNEFNLILDKIHRCKKVKFYHIGYKSKNENLEKRINYLGFNYIFIPTKENTWDEILNIL